MKIYLHRQSCQVDQLLTGSFCYAVIILRWIDLELILFYRIMSSANIVYVGEYGDNVQQPSTGTSYVHFFCRFLLFLFL